MVVSWAMCVGREGGLRRRVMRRMGCERERERACACACQGVLFVQGCPNIYRALAAEECRARTGAAACVGNRCSPQPLQTRCPSGRLSTQTVPEMCGPDSDRSHQRPHKHTHSHSNTRTHAHSKRHTARLTAPLAAD